MNTYHKVWTTITTDTYKHLLQSLGGVERDCYGSGHFEYSGVMAETIKSAIFLHDVQGIADLSMGLEDR